MLVHYTEPLSPPLGTFLGEMSLDGVNGASLPVVFSLRFLRAWQWRWWPPQMPVVFTGKPTHQGPRAHSSPQGLSVTLATRSGRWTALPWTVALALFLDIPHSSLANLGGGNEGCFLCPAKMRPGC